MKQLQEYLEESLILHQAIDDNYINIGEHIYSLVKEDEDGKLFDEDFRLIVDESEDVDRYVYFFGGKWYWDDKDNIDTPQLNPLSDIGECSVNSENIPFLGIHGIYEILNGSRQYEDWCRKSSFLKINTLGICEKNTLAGVMKFQQACLGAKIKPIIGATYTVDRNDYRYDIKCYVSNKAGWANILKINKEARVNNNGHIKEKDFFKLTRGLVIVIDPKSIDFDQTLPIELNVEEFYYQFDSVEYVSNDRDKWYLENLKKFINSKNKPILINDAYYLNKRDSYIKKKLNLISSSMSYESTNQYFKPHNIVREEFEHLFNDERRLDIFLSESKENVLRVSSQCNFLIDVSKRHLPRFKEEKLSGFSSSEELFWHLIEKGLSERVPEGKLDEYIDRVEKEYSVIKEGDVIEYFLVLWDVIEWCKKQNMLTGIARGSAGGCLISYLLYITHIDPIQYGLLFERFLNEGRVKKTLPDIDIDFPGKRRGEVKRYIESTYGEDQVCSIGTYTTLQLKALLKDFGRLYGVSVGEMNYITTILDGVSSLSGLFKIAAQNKRVRKMVEDCPEIINSIDLVLEQVKSESIHACAMLIVPNKKTIFEWVPVRWGERDGERMLVSEWEGGELDAAGFLKEDILGIKQLDKISDILNSVKEREGVDIDIYNIPYDDKKVYVYFQRGWNKDVFHLGSRGLTEYCKELQPENIEYLIAEISLYRPGAMESNSHHEYVFRKNGDRVVEYYEGSEEITKITYGLYVYQEQVMRACTDIGGFSLIEGDNIRKAMGKKDRALLDSYRDQFVQGGVDKGYCRNRVDELWTVMEKFARYAFNRSHAAAYSMTGYICQWLKVHYPIYFWTTAFSYAKDEDISGYISEIHKTGDIKVTPPDINISRDTFTTDFEKNSITWSLTSIKQVAEKSVEEILRKREEEGEIFSFEEFLSRHAFKGSKVNKSVIENLILSGCFDKVEDIKQPTERIKLIDFYREKAKAKVDKEKDKFHTDKDFLDEDWWWILQQKLLSGFAIFPYEDLIEKALEAKGYELIDVEDFFEEDSEGKKVKVGGYISEIKIRNSRKGEYAKMRIESNYEFINVTIWAEQWDVLRGVLGESEKKIILLSGRIQYDSYDKRNSLVLSDESEVLVLE